MKRNRGRTSRQKNKDSDDDDDECCRRFPICLCAGPHFGVDPDNFNNYGMGLGVARANPDQDGDGRDQSATHSSDQILAEHLQKEEEALHAQTTQGTSKFIADDDEDSKPRALPSPVTVSSDSEDSDDNSKPPATPPTTPPAAPPSANPPPTTTDPPEGLAFVENMFDEIHTNGMEEENAELVKIGQQCWE